MRLVPVSVLLFTALSCSDPAAPEYDGALSFAYTGAGGGSFTASGPAPSFNAPPPTSTSWVVGYMESGEAYVFGGSPRSGGLIDLAILRLERTTAGSASIDVSCDLDASTSCTGMQLLLNFNGNGDSGDFFCSLTSGTIVLAEIDASRARGTFSGSGGCVSGTDGSASAFSVSTGTFDVPVVDPPA